MIRATRIGGKIEEHDPVGVLALAVTHQAIKDAKDGDGSAWEYLWVACPDIAQQLWDEHGHTIPGGDVVAPVEDKRIASEEKRRLRRRQRQAVMAYAAD